MSVMHDAREAMDQAHAEWQERHLTLVPIMKLLNLSQRELADRMGHNEMWLSNRVKGRHQIHPWEMVGFAIALDIPVEILYMSPAEAVKALVTAYPERLSPKIRNTCSSQPQGVAA
jgi:transcriptional regulator with XRE-family HTH domain